MLEAHVACGKEISKLPREITQKDRKVKFGSDFFDMFRKKYEEVFGYNILIEENVPKDANKNRVKRAEKRLFKTYGSKVELELRTRLFENPAVIKASECRYRDISGFVIIYYDMLTDLFAIVDTKSNKLLEFSLATEINYADIFRYKSVFRGQVVNETIECPNAELNPFEPICPVEKGPLRQEEDIRLEFNTFDKVKNRGWWLERQNEIARSVDPKRLAELSIEKTKKGPQQTVITELEALSILQAEREKLVGGVSRPDMFNNEKEAKLNLDFKILSWDKWKFPGWFPTYADIKSPLDPEVIRARNEPEQSLEDQVNNLLKTISIQRQRAIENQESVIHIINLLRIKP